MKAIKFKIKEHSLVWTNPDEATETDINHVRDLAIFQHDTSMEVDFDGDGEKFYIIEGTQKQLFIFLHELCKNYDVELM